MLSWLNFSFSMLITGCVSQCRNFHRFYNMYNLLKAFLKCIHIYRINTHYVVIFGLSMLKLRLVKMAKNSFVKIGFNAYNKHQEIPTAQDTPVLAVKTT